jgi:signal transduction histidine kinase/DNA-binding NarL/FixJ family response regulator
MTPRRTDPVSSLRRPPAIASLRGQLVAIVAAFALSFIGLTVLMADRFVRAERETSRAQLVVSARMLALAVERELEVSRAALTVLAQTQSLRTADFARFHRLASEAAAKLGTGAIVAVFSRDAQLTSTASPVGTPLPYRPGPSRAAIEELEEKVSDLFESPTLARGTYVLAQPITIGNTPRPEHALAIVVPVERFASMLLSQDQPAGLVSTVYDGSGRVLARSRDPDQWVGRLAPEDYRRQVARGGSAGPLEAVTLDGTAVEGAFARIAGTAWTVAVSGPARGSFGSAFARQTGPLVATALLLLGIALFAAAALSRQILRPLAELGDAARTIDKGPVPPLAMAARLRETRPIVDALRESHANLARARDAQDRHTRDLHEMAEALEARVRDRTDALETQAVALREAQAAAEAANQAKSAFLAQMSHEIRTPMTAVLALTDLLLLDAARPRDAERLRLLRSSAASLRGLLDDVLDFAKIESGRIVLAHAPFAPRELVADVVGLFRPLASTKDCFIAFDASAAPARVSADAARIRQVLVNLVGNAVKFTDDGRIDVRVWADGPSRLRFRVSDTGIGVSDDVKRRIFEPFEQGDVETARRFGGAGLGLAICRELVHAMGGEIAIDAAPGQGAAFEFDVVVEPADAPATAADAAVPAPSGAADGFQPRRILIAEDNDVTREVERTILERDGHTVVAVADGVEAVRAAADTRFDVVVLDIRMPRMDGVAAAREIRRDARSRGVPIIALSADPLAFRSQELAGVFDAVLEKPIDWAKLAAAMAAHAPAQAGAQSAAAVDAPVSAPAAPRAAPDADPVFADLDDGWDGRVIRRLGKGKSEDALRTLLADFVTACERQLEVLWTLHEDGDAARMRDEAHMLAGLAATFGWTGVARAARDLEHAQSDAQRARLLRQIAGAVRGFDAARVLDVAMA